MRSARRNRSKNQAMAAINVVPYIDVMLVLLIIFMVTAPLMMQGLEVKLPEVVAESINLNTQEPVVISVKKQGLFYLNIHSEPETNLTAEQIVFEVKQRLAQKPSTSVLINGDADASHGLITQVMSWLRQAGIKQVGIMTKPSTPK